MKNIYVITIVAALICLAILLSFFGFIEQKENPTVAQHIFDNALSSGKADQLAVENETIGHEPKTPHPDSIDAMRLKEFQGDGLELGAVLDQNESYTRHYITYQSEGFTISGIMNVPVATKGGPFPVIIANHGYIDPDVYQNGAGLKREQDFLARQGYVVVHSDYRNHADSDFDPLNEVRPRSGYVEDIMNLIAAIKRSDLEFIDRENMGMLGHSMGGGVTLNVMAIAPAEIKAYVLLAPINADYRKNFDRWVADTWPEVAQQVMDTYGTFEENPEFWNSVSAINYLGNVNVPVQLHQGTADREVPVQWSRDLAVALQDQGKQIEYFEYPKIDHLFLDNFLLVMEHTVGLFDRELMKNEN